MALRVQNFLGRLPIGFNVVILSPHGFFGQANVLGKPDTGGQVCTCHDLCVLVLKKVWVRNSLCHIASMLHAVPVPCDAPDVLLCGSYV